MKNRKIHLPKLLSWQEGTMMSGQCLAQQNTQCDQGTGTVLRRTQRSTPGLWGQSQGISTKAAAAAAQEPPCNDEFAQGNREKSFFRDVNSSEMSQLIFPLVTPEQNQWCPGSSRKILPNELQGLGIGFFSHWVLLLRTYIPRNGIPS